VPKEALITMSIWTYRGRFRENELSLFGKSSTVLLIVLAAFAAIVNILRGEVQHPAAFFVVLIGFVLFIAAKLSVVSRGKWISFGTSQMTENMANAYRVGYWLMVVGILFTFVP
jgi:hypothetical protein